MNNILILSSGTRNKIVQYFKKELRGNGKVVCTDCDSLAPSLYEADAYYIVPRITEPTYLDAILEICEKEDINGIFSLIDPELSLLAKNKEMFESKGIMVFVSDYEQVEMCFDKYRFYEFCKKYNFPTIQTYINIETFRHDYKAGRIKFPVFIKPRNGSCSIHIQKIETMKELEFEYNRNENLIVQEFMNGTEYGIDVYVDMISKEIISIFIKKKLLMRAGETDKAVSVINDEMFKQIEKFVKQGNFKGQIDIDMFEKDGEYYFSEVNPRFGGGYPHAYECGCNFPKFMINNIEHVVNRKAQSKYKENVFMMKHLEVLITS